MLHLLVFPESRVQFIKLLGQAGILTELNASLSASEVDFWSYAIGLREVLGNSNPELPFTSPSSKVKLDGVLHGSPDAENFITTT